ncbi:MAG: helix-turn-helix domain-containing protein [Actinobacteria bacterium]|nr:helix-turn-helix domain-containing protein [Actinomycetota bacterium]MCA1740654.1 helix-turn-helix domain-containing protein [Actinomycetota bacterium]
MGGKELKKRRLEKGLTQHQLARLSGVSRREIFKAENGLLKLGGRQSASLLAALRRS